MTEAAIVETPATEPTAAASSPPPQPASPAPAPAAGPAPTPAPSLLARGAAAAPSPAPAEGTPPASPIPAKYQVKKDDGTIDLEASIAKWGDGHKHLEQRLGAGDAPPATPEDYAPIVPPGTTLEELKADPLFTGFLKGAHGKGMTNAQVSYVLDAYAARMAMSASPEAGEAELRKEWATDDQMRRGLTDSLKAVKSFSGGDEARAQRIDAKFGNDPDFVWLMAQVGKELHEDTPVGGALTEGEAQSLESLMASPAYLDAKHPEHAATSARVKALYEKRYAGR